MIGSSDVQIKSVEVAEGYYTVVQTAKWVDINEVISETVSHAHDITWKDRNEGYIKLTRGEAIAVGLKIVERHEGHECDNRPLGRTRDFGTHYDIRGCKWVVEVSAMTMQGTRNTIIRFVFTFPMQSRYPTTTAVRDAKAEHVGYALDTLNNELATFSDFLDHYIERITTS